MKVSWLYDQCFLPQPGFIWCHAMPWSHTSGFVQAKSKLQGNTETNDQHTHFYELLYAFKCIGFGFTFKNFIV